MNNFFGIGASPGTGIGVVRLVLHPKDIQEICENEIIVAKDATPYLLPGLLRASGAICERGGLTCHLAVLAREIAKPCVVGIGEAMMHLHPGSLVMINGNTGEIIVCDDQTCSG